MRRIIAGAAFLLLPAMPACADQTQPHTIAVQGEAEMRLAPDLATIEVGVITQGTVVADVLAENSAKMSRVIEALRSLGIPDADIHTSTFDIQPRYEKQIQGQYDEEALRPIVGYLVSNKATVTVTDMTKIAKIIDDTVRAGANASGRVGFRVKNLTQYMDKARVAAMDAAHHKAEVLTAAAHVGLGQALSITDNQANTYYNGRPGPEGDGLESVVVTGYRASTPILPGQITITSEVTVVYATK